VRKAFDAASLAYTYLGYGSFLGQYCRRLPLKLWTGWTTFPMLFVKGVFVVGARHLDSRIRSGALGVKAPLAPGPALAYTLAPLRLVASAREGDPGGMRGKPSLRCEPSKPEISATALRIPRPRAQNNTNRLSSEWS